MPQYVYQCPNKHKEEITHSIKWEPAVYCLCGEPMQRVPVLGAMWHRNALDTLYDWSEVNLKRWKKKQPRFSPDHVNNPDGIPGIEGHYRRKTHAR